MKKRRDVIAGLLMLWLTGALLAQPPSPPPRRSRGEVEAVLRNSPRVPAGKSRNLTLVLLADKKDHGANEHDYPSWQKRWVAWLGGGSPAESAMVQRSAGRAGVKVLSAWEWPLDSQFREADVIIAHCYLKWTAERLSQVRNYLARGGGVVLIHPASWTMPGPSPEVAALFGVGGYTQYRHGPVKVQIRDPRHPICAGFPASFDLLDEMYWPPTPFQADRVEVLATSEERDVPGSPVTQPQPLFWTFQLGQGRVFGCVPGHYVWTFDDPLFRLLLLRGIAWTAGEAVCRFDDLAMAALD